MATNRIGIFSNPSFEKGLFYVVGYASSTEELLESLNMQTVPEDFNLEYEVEVDDDPRYLVKSLMATFPKGIVNRNKNFLKVKLSEMVRHIEQYYDLPHDSQFDVQDSISEASESSFIESENQSTFSYESLRQVSELSNTNSRNIAQFVEANSQKVLSKAPKLEIDSQAPEEVNVPEPETEVKVAEVQSEEKKEANSQGLSVNDILNRVNESNNAEEESDFSVSLNDDYSQIFEDLNIPENSLIHFVGHDLEIGKVISAGKISYLGEEVTLPTFVERVLRDYEHKVQLNDSNILSYVTYDNQTLEEIAQKTIDEAAD
ncbi:MAG: hypothetical protein LBM27_06070 [Lactobacillaceae bacterium]|nr:hypothetical protein [Lactobacillaceae bacterium]